MTKTLTAGVLTQKNAAYKRIVLLYEIYLNLGTLRYAAYISNVTFPTGGNTYVAKAIQFDSVAQTAENQIGRINIRFSNVLNDMAAYANIEDFKGKKIIIKRVYLGSIATANDYEEVFNGTLEKPSSIGYEWFTVGATTGKALNKKVLNFPYQRMCPWKAGGTECNTDGNFDLTTLKATGTADSGTTTTLVDNALTQVNDFWNFGRIEITKSSVTYIRKVKDFNATTDTIILDIGLDFAIDNTCTYVVYKGCDKTWNTCQGNNAWGPSSDNKLNWGGNIHISKEQDSIINRGQGTPVTQTPVPFDPWIIPPPNGWSGYNIP